MLRFLKCSLFAALISCAALSAAQSQLTIEQLIDIKHPSQPMWSPDGKQVLFVWDRAGVSNLYVAGASAAGSPSRPITDFNDANAESYSDAFWSRDGQTIYFPRKGGLSQVPAGGGQARAAWTSSTHENDFTPSPDTSLLAFVRSGEGDKGAELVVRSLADGKETIVARDPNSIGGLKWSPDGKSVAYIAGSRLVRHDESPAYSGAKLIYANNEYTPGELSVVPVSGGQPSTIGDFRGYNNVYWAGPSRLVFDRESDDFKKRTIYLAETSGGAPKALHEDVEEKFWSIWWDYLPDGQPKLHWHIAVGPTATPGYL